MVFEGRTNQMIKVLTVFGTRPEAIKVAPLLRKLREHPQVESRICVTGQHRDMLDQVLDLFEISPHYDLNIMKPNQSLAYVTQQVLSGVDQVLETEKPDWLLVQGDTTTAMAAPLAAFYRGVKVGHVEAGLRSLDKLQPFPEEINRRIADVIADIHFAPTELARQNLLAEGFRNEDIIVTGNTIIDALRYILSTAARQGNSGPDAGQDAGDRVILVTAHRRENFGEPIRQICRALRHLSSSYGDSVRILYPVHPNPNIRGPVYELLDGVPGIELLEPLNYAEFVRLMDRSYFIISDSGGIQEEATVLGKPILVMRDTTERSEAIAVGAAKLVGTDADLIIREASHLLEDRTYFDSMSQKSNVFGDGRASERIVDCLVAQRSG